MVATVSFTLVYVTPPAEMPVSAADVAGHAAAARIHTPSGDNTQNNKAAGRRAAQ